MSGYQFYANRGRRERPVPRSHVNGDELRGERVELLGVLGAPFVQRNLLVNEVERLDPRLADGVRVSRTSKVGEFSYGFASQRFSGGGTTKELWRGFEFGSNRFTQ